MVKTRSKLGQDHDGNCKQFCYIKINKLIKSE